MDREKFGFDVKTDVFANGEIHLNITSNIGNINGDLCRQVIHTQEQQVRESLIKLGWTPPSQQLAKPVEPLLEALRYYIDNAHIYDSHHFSHYDPRTKAREAIAAYDALQD
jgi:hypothetical protein